MHLFAAAALPHIRTWEVQALVTVVFIVYMLVSFLRVSGYATEQVRAGRLLHAGHTPPTWTLPPFVGLLYILSVLLLLLYQSPFYMIVVVTGLSLCLIETRRTAVEQFGLARMRFSKLVKWSALICGAVIFVEIPLTEILEVFYDRLHLVHPQQESVEFFRGIQRGMDLVSFLVLAVAISPLIEELFFRGFLLTFLKNSMSTWLAIIVSAGIFAVAHANLGAFVQLWLLGIVLGVAYEHTGSLLLPMGIHGCWNLITALSLLFERGFN